MAAQRNEPCPCGSGKKYKHCCADSRTSSQWLALASVVVFAVAAVWALAGVMGLATDPAPAAPEDSAGRVWSEEHGHWHDAPGKPGVARPGGPAPPGKVWSVEHGHWHDAGGEAPGPAPPGKVWSVEHGHWHDAATGGEAPGPAPPGKVWSAEHGHWHDAATGGEVAADPVANPESSVSFVDD